MIPPAPSLGLVAALLLLALLAAPVASQQPRLGTYSGSQEYAYYGCYNETTGMAGSDRSRALSGGITEVRPGEMTVPLCLAFCGNGATQYRYAGLEWARECWCAQSLAGIAERLGDEQCSFACEGDNTTACGASLKLSVYRLSSPAARLVASAALVSVSAALAVCL